MLSLQRSCHLVTEGAERDPLDEIAILSEQSSVVHMHPDPDLCQLSSVNPADPAVGAPPLHHGLYVIRSAGGVLAQPHDSVHPKWVLRSAGHTPQADMAGCRVDERLIAARDAAERTLEGPQQLRAVNGGEPRNHTVQNCIDPFHINNPIAGLRGYRDFSFPAGAAPR